MTPTTLEIRPGLHIEIEEVPGATRIQWQVAGGSPCLFDPADTSWHPVVPGDDLKAILDAIPPADLALIATRLGEHAEQRRRHLAALNVTALFFLETNEGGGVAPVMRQPCRARRTSRRCRE